MRLRVVPLLLIFILLAAVLIACQPQSQVVEVTRLVDNPVVETRVVEAEPEMVEVTGQNL